MQLTQRLSLAAPGRQPGGRDGDRANGRDKCQGERNQNLSSDRSSQGGLTGSRYRGSRCRTVWNEAAGTIINDSRSATTALCRAIDVQTARKLSCRVGLHGKCGLFPASLLPRGATVTNPLRPGFTTLTRNCENPMTDAELLSCLNKITDPELGKSFGELRMVKQASVVEGAPTVEIELPTPAYPRQERFQGLIDDAVRARFPAVPAARVNISWKVRGKETGGKIGLRVKNVIAVGSGKGGVGKSTTASVLAYGLQSFGAKVGLLDADVYGPSIPHLCGASGQPQIVAVADGQGQTIERLKPVEKDGLLLLSIGFMVGEDQAIVWRGPMLHKLLTQFLQQTDWGELDYLIIDLPPGTGDVSLTLSQLLGLAGAVVVCTPQKVALLDAVKAISMFNQVKIPVLGIVENMSGDIFGRGGAAAQAAKSGVPFLGEVPIDAQIRVLGDDGRIGDVFKDDSPSKAALTAVCQNVAMQVARSLIESPELPTLEIL